LISTGRKGSIVSQPRGVEHYHAARAVGRGVIIATAHTAGWDVAGPVLSGIHPGEVVVAMQRERDPQARAIQDSARKRAGVKVVHIGESPFDALPLLRYLQNRAVVAMQIDRVPPGMRHRTVHLFGGDWPAPEGPLTLAALSGSPILPVFTRRVGFMQYEAIVSPAICLPRRPSRERLDEAAQQMMNAMQAVVQAYPTQWFHFV
jgi:KDO2-lipid IV(A) lauroyltransferase